MNRTWGLVLLTVALSGLALSALTWANVSPRARATHQYRCDQQRNVIALERPEYVSLMVAGRSYDLEWTNLSTAQGHGLIWRVSKNRAALTRVSSGFALASGCTRV